jgi:hypothetical protein
VLSRPALRVRPPSDAQTHRDAVFRDGGRLAAEACAAPTRAAAGRANIYRPGRHSARQMPAGAKAAMCRTHRYKYVRRLYESDELCDLAADPGERGNRMADPSLAGVLADLREQLTTWSIETGDVVPDDADRREGLPVAETVRRRAG